MGLLAAGLRLPKGGVVGCGEAGLPEGGGLVGTLVSGGYVRRWVCPCILVHGCPRPGIICGVECKVVFGAACVSLATFVPEAWTVSVVAWVWALAVRTFEGTT